VWVFVTVGSGRLESECVCVIFSVGTKVLVAVMVELREKLICRARVSVLDTVGDLESDNEMDSNGVHDIVCPMY